MKRPELLAPAGNFECLEAALHHGADAVYAGVGTFNLRAYSTNLSGEQLPRAVEYVHQKNKKLFIVLNSMPYDRQLEQIEQFITTTLLQSPTLPDAFIVSDPGVISLCRQYCPDIPLHLSTQTGTFNSRALSFWASQGISRIILPRELSCAQIRSLSQAQCCETEIFIHGAMCVSISGRCLLGAYIAGRHPNQGECPQPCRYSYTVIPNTPPGTTPSFSFCAEENEQGTYLLNSKDLNTLAILPALIDTGVSSLKIEGRNKSVHYVSTVVKTYRSALDRYFENPSEYSPDPQWFDELNNLDHRPYTTGFYTGEYALQEQIHPKVQASIRVVGIVKALTKDGRGIVDVKNPFTSGNTISILPVASKKAPYETVIDTITDINENVCDRALTNRLVVISIPDQLRVGDILRTVL